jgi:hypothetical protein
MHRQESELTEYCHVCGEELDPTDARNFALAPSVVVCFECASRHGGRYDAETERWKKPPSIPGNVPPAARE